MAHNLDTPEGRLAAAEARDVFLGAELLDPGKLAAVAGKDRVLVVDEDRHRDIPLAHRRRDHVDLFGGMDAGVAGMRLEIAELADLPMLDPLLFRPPTRDPLAL